MSLITPNQMPLCSFLEELSTIANKIGGMMLISLLFLTHIAIIIAKYIKDSIKPGKHQKIKLPLTSQSMLKNIQLHKLLLQVILWEEPQLTTVLHGYLVMIITTLFILLDNQESVMTNSLNGSKRYILTIITELLMDKTQYHTFHQFLMDFYTHILKFSIKITQLLKLFVMEMKTDTALINGNFQMLNTLMTICGI